MPATSLGKVRSLESPRKARRSSNTPPVVGPKGRSSERKASRVQVIAAKHPMAHNLPSAKRTGHGGSGPDLAARLLDRSPAETLVQLTPGQMLRITREFAELSQDELAERAGLTQATISSIESGRVTLGLERAKRLAQAMHVHPASLLFPYSGEHA